MFDIGFWEMALVALVALLVVGPRELPALLRTVSSWVSRSREIAAEFRNELSREVARTEELKRLIEREAEVAELHKLLDEARSTVPLDTPADKGDNNTSHAIPSAPKTPDTAPGKDGRSDGQAT